MRLKKTVFKTLKIIMIFVLLFTFSCKKNTSMSFSEMHISEEDMGVVEIYFPIVEGTSEAAKNINTTLKTFASDVLHFSDSLPKATNLKSAVKQFKTAYKTFLDMHASDSLSKPLPVWEAFVNGELLYKDHKIVCIAINYSVVTGSANSPLMLRFLNFNIETGKLLSTSDLISDIRAFTILAKKHYNKVLLTEYKNKAQIEALNTFKLPETLGFSEEGVIFFYNNFKTETPHQDVLEFTIPYAEADAFLK